MCAGYDQPKCVVPIEPRVATTKGFISLSFRTGPRVSLHLLDGRRGVARGGLLCESQSKKQFEHAPSIHSHPRTRNTLAIDRFAVMRGAQ